MSHWERIKASAGGRRAVSAGACRPCGAEVLIGLTQLGITFTVDPDPISALGEVIAIGQGRPTFELYSDSGSWVIDLRVDDYISARPAGTKAREDVLAGHECWADPLPTTESNLPAYAAPDPMAAWRTDAPPF